jgi:alpha-tubulin suppressor-like RCC1 family protein
MRIIRDSLLIVAGLPTLWSCGGGGDGGNPSGPVSVASVTVSPSQLTLFVGQVQQFTAKVRDASGRDLTSRAVTWSTSNSAVATASATGVATAVGPGPVTITATSEGQAGSATVTVTATVTFASVAAGGAHSCALTSSGSAYCWGRGESGQLGAPAPTVCTDIGPCSLIALAVAGGFSFTQVVAGGAHTCALTSDGSAYCWGNNTSGQLGDNSTTARTAPTAVATNLKFATLDAGTNHTCGLTISGAAYCWGANSRGQLGDGTTTNRSVPVAVSGALTFQIVTAGGFDIGQTCGLTTGGAAYCWGDNERGQLGTGASNIAAHSSPAQVSGGLTFVGLSAGLGRHTCGFTSAGAAYCWGENSFGALGNGSSTDSPVPTAVSGGIVFTQLKAGGFIGHTCGFTAAGVAYCWGENERGQVGDGSTVDRLTPSAVTGGLNFVSLEAGFRHTCGRASDGIVYCWGSNAAGQLGNNSTTQAAAPVRVIGQR